ncbi:hypothetical protein BT69DRAFT_487894 [Atractiella rhizophila]|nr:hypothetical protein BT69DRAFT_487894 [Atractiella rhizophila]
MEDSDEEEATPASSDLLSSSSDPVPSGHRWDSPALVHIIAPEPYSDSPPQLHLSILPSFISLLPHSIRTIRVSFIIDPEPTLEPLEKSSESLRESLPRLRPTLSNFSLEYLWGSLGSKVDKDDAAKLYLLIQCENAEVSFTRDDCLRSFDGAYDLLEDTLDLPLHSESRSQAIFAPVPFFSFGDSESNTTIIQLSHPLASRVCFISRLPPEILSVIIDFVEPNPCMASTLADVCELWRTISAPYQDYPKGRHAHLKRYPGAGRLWTELHFFGENDPQIAKELVIGAPNVTSVWLHAFWNEEQAKMVLDAIVSLKKVKEVSFDYWGENWGRKWNNAEVESFTQRMGDGITKLSASGVKDSSSTSSADSQSLSVGLQLSPNLISLYLYDYPPLPSLSLPQGLRHLDLSVLCPLPPSISSSPLPSLLKRLLIHLESYWANGTISMLPSSLDLSHLTQLTFLSLDGGAETSNLVSYKFFNTLKTATVIENISIWYCVVESPGFPEFISWFFGDRGLKTEADEDESVKGNSRIGRALSVCLFFGEWDEEDMRIARRTMRECGARERSTGDVFGPSGVCGECMEE